MNLSAGAPVAMSLPHFLDGEPEYLNQTIGLSPNFAEHGTYLDVEPVCELSSVRLFGCNIQME